MKKQEKKKHSILNRVLAAAALALLAAGLLFLKLRPAPDRIVARPAEADRALVELQERARAKRAAGLSALQRGDLERAIADFSGAQELLGESAEVSELLRVAQDWKARAAAAKAASARAKPSGPSAPVRGAGLGRAAARGPSAPARVAKADAAEEQPEPSGAGESARQAEGAARERPAAGAPWGGDPAGNRGAAPAPPPAASPPTARALPPAAVVASPEPAEVDPGKGGLDVTSPGLYAEVWINGRSYGFPPIAARNLPAGAAEVVVRINGDVVRTAQAVVVRDQVTQLKVR